MDRKKAGYIHVLMAVILFVSGFATSQERPLLIDKQGTFEMLEQVNYTGNECGFSRTEITDNLKEITTLVEIIRRNPVLTDLRGFDGKARICNMNCTEKGAYGIPSRISFEFCSWFLKKDGTPTRNTIEPPNWDIIINKQKPSTAWPFSADEFSADHNCFMVPAKKETLQPGIDLYDGEIYVMYNPDRPSYWLPVTIDEAFTKLITYWKNQPDKVAGEFMLKTIERDYAAFPALERKKPAHYGSGRVESLTGISSDTSAVPILQVNPGYWDKSLPRSSIQLMYFRIVNNKPYLKSLKEESLRNNSISYNVYRFQETLDINTARSLVPLLRK